MKPFTKHTGKVVAMDRGNVDTDQIIPKQFLKRIERTGYGEFLFYDWRFNSDGSVIDDFVLNDPRYAGASILIAGDNFGCGSSREHAPWSLTDYGFRVVIAPAFADIFHSNSLKNSLLPVTLSENDCSELGARAANVANYSITVDLETQTVSDDLGFHAAFEIDEFRRHCMMHGLDDIALTMLNEDKITAFEASAAFGKWPASS